MTGERFMTAGTIAAESFLSQRENATKEGGCCVVITGAAAVFTLAGRTVLDEGSDGPVALAETTHGTDTQRRIIIVRAIFVRGTSLQKSPHRGICRSNSTVAAK
jgi:hypothetical protein